MIQDTRKELEDYIRDTFTDDDYAKLFGFMATILDLDIQGLSLKEAAAKIAHAIRNTDKEKFNTELLAMLRGQKNIARVETVRPKKYISPNTKASNKLFMRDNTRYYDGMRILAAEGDKSKKAISVSLFVAYKENENIGIKLSGPYKGKYLTPFDRVIHDAIIALYVDGKNEYITTNMIYQVISGNSDGLTSENPVSKSLSAAISESIDRLFHSYVEIDASQQAAAYGFDDGRYKGHLLNCSITEASLNGNISTCAHICEMPVLYRYAHDSGQVLRYDVKTLNVPKLENSPECIVLKTYLMQQIQIMSHHRDFSRTICFDTLYELLNIDAPSDAALRMKKKQIRDHVITCLEYWQTEGLITGYKLNKQGKSFVSVTLGVKLINKNSIPAELV